jgi:hypothetical protein
VVRCLLRRASAFPAGCDSDGPPQRLLVSLSSDEIRVTTAIARAWEAGAASCYPRMAAEQSGILVLEMLNVERRMA